MDDEFAMTIGYITNYVSLYISKINSLQISLVKFNSSFVLTQSAKRLIISTSKLIEVFKFFYFLSRTSLKLNC